MRFRRCGSSGLRLPEVALGMWQNFGEDRPFAVQRAIVLRAFERGVTHIDLANGYGPPPGGAETTFGRLLRGDLRAHRNELIISTKAGHRMWAGPYGTGGSRKHLIASLDQSLARLGLDYVDIFYSHAPDPDTPLEETLAALADAVRAGKALHVGISSYDTAQTHAAARTLRELGTPLLVHQPRYSLLDRWIEHTLLDTLQADGIGCVIFSPLAQGVLAGRYLDGVPADSRAVRGTDLPRDAVASDRLDAVRALADVARRRGQTLAQLALAWVLRDPRVTTALVGASSVAQLDENLDALAHSDFTTAEVAEIDRIVPRAPLDAPS